jgi:hypothetical protein
MDRNPALLLPPFSPEALAGEQGSWAESLIAPLDYLYLDVLKLGQPWMRAAFTFAAISAGEFFLKPSAMFEGEDTRAWYVTNPSDKSSTSLPWWMIPAAGGILSALLI